MAHDHSEPGSLGSYPDDSQLTVVESTAASESCIILPTETIYHILCFLEPRDLIRLRAVSKELHAIIRDPAVWRTLYSTIRLPLPPGPFPWQSVHFLERTLVRSARLAPVWIPEPLTLISKQIYPGPRTIQDDRHKWVLGRWLIVSKNMEQLCSRDIETGSEQVLWDHGKFAFWAAASVMNPLGHFIYVAVHLWRGLLSDPVRLLEFVVNDDTGHLSGPKILDVPTWTLPNEAFIPRIRVNSGLAPYVYISLCSANKPRQSLIFDPQNRRFYKFPRFRTQLDLLLNYRGAWLPHLVEVYFTKTHLFVLNRSYLIHGYLGNIEVIQTFAFPDNNSDSDTTPGSDGVTGEDSPKPVVRELRLTHEILSRDTGSLWLAPVRNAIVDPVTKTTTLRFMHTYAPFQPNRESCFRVVCTDYILPPPPPPGSTRTISADQAHREENDSNNNNDGLINRSLSTIVRSIEPVLPMTVVSHDIFSLQGVWYGNVVDASEDGFVRGLCMIGCYSEGSEIPDVGMVHKFTVDATGERCIAVVGDRYPPWDGLNTSRYYEYSFDGMRGRVWQTKFDILEMNSSGQPVDKDTLAIVADFQ